MAKSKTAAAAVVIEASVKEAVMADLHRLAQIKKSQTENSKEAGSRQLSVCAALIVGCNPLPVDKRGYPTDAAASAVSDFLSGPGCELSKGSVARYWLTVRAAFQKLRKEDLLPSQATVAALQTDVFPKLKFGETEGVTSMADLQKWAGTVATGKDEVDIAIDALLGAMNAGTQQRMAPKGAKGQSLKQVAEYRAKLLARFQVRLAVEQRVIAAQTEAGAKAKAEGVKIAEVMAKIRADAEEVERAAREAEKAAA